MSALKHNKPCSVEGCARTILARGLCGMHYQRWWKGKDIGGPEMLARGSSLRRLSVRDRFNAQWKREESGCWLWTGTISGGAYGQTIYLGERIPAHKLSYILNRGVVPDGMLVCHTCDNPPCVNPDHLFLGDHRDNARDMVCKGRDNPRWGENHPDHRLKTEDIREIISRVESGETQRSVAMVFGVDQSHISRIISGQNRSREVAEIRQGG